MSIIGNPIMAGASGPAASIFVTGLSETDTVTATNGSKTLAGKWSQKPNPAYVTLPDGYTQLEYIESTGTQYIDTGLGGSSDYITTVIALATGNGIAVFGSNGGNGFSLTLNLNGVCYWRSIGIRYDSQGIDITKPCKYVCANRSFYINDTAVTATLTDSGFITGSKTVLLFGTNREEGEPNLSASKIYKYEVKSASSGAVLINFVPAKRNSDGAIGMYDLVTNSFFENGGTGTFIAGAEVPQTINGFLIKPIRDFGTWTVTATDGVHTKTQDVLVDVITEYEIEMSYKLWLYKDDDECEDVTGGWVDKANNSTYGYFKKQSGYLEIGCSSASYYYQMGVSKDIGISGYTKAYVDMQFFSGSYSLASYSRGLFGIGGKSTSFSYGAHSGIDNQSLSTNRTVLELDISGAAETHLSTQNVIHLGANGQIKVYRIWLE